MPLVASDGKGTPCTEFEYDLISHQCGFFFLEKDEKGGFADIDGHIYLQAVADAIYEPDPYCDIVTYEIAGKTGYIALGARADSGALYDGCDYDEEGYIVVTKDGLKGYIDRYGNFTQDESQKFFCAAYGDYWDCGDGL